MSRAGTLSMMHPTDQQERPVSEQPEKNETHNDVDDLRIGSWPATGPVAVVHSKTPCGWTATRMLKADGITTVVSGNAMIKEQTTGNSKVYHRCERKWPTQKVLVIMDSCFDD